MLFDKDLDASGREKSEKYIVVSLRDEDCFAKTTNVFPVNYIFSKPNDAKLYDALVYVDQKSAAELQCVVIDKLDSRIKELILNN